MATKHAAATDTPTAAEPTPGKRMRTNGGDAGDAAVIADAGGAGKKGAVRVVKPDSFEPEMHFYPRSLNAQIHPIVRAFMTMDTQRLLKRYCHMHPKVPLDLLTKHIMYQPRFFRWAGCDTFNTTTATGFRRTVVVETNSCPSGQKSMPLTAEDDEYGSYRKMLQNTFAPRVKQEVCEVTGLLAVVFDKNPMEATGYAAALADELDEDVLLAEFFASDPDPPVRFDADGVMSIRHDGEWVVIRACFRYVTQRPWNRLPIVTKTVILNPIIACIAGGRNKLLADKAYEMYNGELTAEGSNLRIQTPETVRDVGKAEVPLWVKTFGGHAVVKVPYSNAGQGVYTILCPADLKAFMDADHPYDKFIVQSLIGNSSWSSVGTVDKNQYFHIGTIPDRRGHIFVTDVRMMVSASPTGFKPLAVYARRTHKPLTEAVPTTAGESWAMLGTNLSVKTGTDSFATESNRLLLMDRKDFTQLGIGIDELIEAFVQTVLAATAIDRMAQRLMPRGKFNVALFKSLNDDESLISELMEQPLEDTEAPSAGAGAGAGRDAGAK